MTVGTVEIMSYYSIQRCWMHSSSMMTLWQSPFIHSVRNVRYEALLSYSFLSLLS